ncbi:uncharacterized protein LOC119590368 [Penaeus monodon]|uniref:uncharacterized protein LOC119590368 n=1 Tax=Penaeus monodon TaxID=6687 RepID=UPI0018A70CBE|nr:uncharacterized protein LOC119590368 [Penaeus monodon]
MERACNLLCKCHVNDLPCYQCVLLECTIVRPMNDMVPQPSAPVLEECLEFFPPSSLEERGPAKPPPSASSGESFVAFRPGEARDEGVGKEAPGGRRGGGGRRCLPPFPHSPPPLSLPRPFLLPSCKREKNRSIAPHRTRSSRNSRREINFRDSRATAYKDQWDKLASRMASVSKVPL